jgi:hypothetical protein
MDGSSAPSDRPTHAAHLDRRSDRGASAVEFGLVSILLFTVLFGIIQYGLFFWQLQGGAAAAREAARYSAVGNWDCPTLDSETTSRVPAGGSVTVTRTYIPDPTGTGTASSPKTGDDVKITVGFSTVAVGGLVPMPNNGVVQSEAQARIETVTTSTGPC